MWSQLKCTIKMEPAIAVSLWILWSSRPVSFFLISYFLHRSHHILMLKIFYVINRHAHLPWAAHLNNQLEFVFLLQIEDELFHKRLLTWDTSTWVKSFAWHARLMLTFDPLDVLRKPMDIGGCVHENGGNLEFWANTVPCLQLCSKEPGGWISTESVPWPAQYVA